MEVTEHTAAEQLKAAERVLRETFARQLATTHGPTWENDLSNRVRDALEKIRDSEREARSHAPDEPNLLGYAGFDHLKAVLTHHWDCCLFSLNVWPTVAIAMLELERLHAVRNPAQHGRTLFPHEYMEGEGLARRLRFKIERQRREAASVTGHYWPYIEEAEDSLGNRSVNSTARSQIFIQAEKPILVGDTVTIRIRAFDPWGRDLRYRVSGVMGDATAWQDVPEFEWTFTTPARQAMLTAEVRAEGQPHANMYGQGDASVSFMYDVRLAESPMSRL